MQAFALSQVNTFCLKKHLLHGRASHITTGDMVNRIIALHATSALTPYLSLWARMTEFKKQDLDNELYEQKKLYRIRSMRRTMFIFTSELAPVAYAACKQLFVKRLNDYLRYRNLTIDDYHFYERLILKALEGNCLTTAEIKKKMDKKVSQDIDVSLIISLMCDLGKIIRTRPSKGWKSQNWRYALIKEYEPDIDLTLLDEYQARIRLIRKYIEVFGPVTENDISWWSGLNKRIIKEVLSIIDTEFVRIGITGLAENFIILKPHIKELKNIEKNTSPRINLLPLLDPYPMGYKQRSRYLDPEYYSYAFDRSGNITSCIFVDGKIIGVWDCIRNPMINTREPMVKLFFFNKINPAVKKEVFREAAMAGEFILENPVKVIECSTMKSLNQRSYGSFMSPLKESL